MFRKLVTFVVVALLIWWVAVPLLKWVFGLIGFLLGLLLAGLVAVAVIVWVRRIFGGRPNSGGKN